MIRFRPTPGFSLFALVGVGILCSLGTWQLNRRAQATETRARYFERLAEPPFDARTPPPDPDLRRVFLEGTPDWDHRFYVHGKYMWMQPGLQLHVPVRMDDGAWVIVDAGWIPMDEAEQFVEIERAVPGPRRYAGLARALPERADSAGTFPLTDGYQRSWRTADPISMGRAAGLTTPGWLVVDGEGLAADADIPDRMPPISGWRAEPQTMPHTEYAFTWFGLALSLVLVWVSASTSFPRRDAPAA